MSLNTIHCLLVYSYLNPHLHSRLMLLVTVHYIPPDWLILTLRYTNMAHMIHSQLPNFHWPDMSPILQFHNNLPSILLFLNSLPPASLQVTSLYIRWRYTVATRNINYTPHHC